MIGKSALSQSKERIHKNFPMLDFQVSTEPDALFHKPHILHISESDSTQ